MRVLVTGAAGFIGSTLSHRLLARGDTVLGFDNLNSYYDPKLKEARLAKLLPQAGFSFVKGSLEDKPTLEAAFDEFKPQRVVNLAAQASMGQGRGERGNDASSWVRFIAGDRCVK